MAPARLLGVVSERPGGAGLSHRGSVVICFACPSQHRATAYDLERNGATGATFAGHRHEARHAKGRFGDYIDMV